ncbi:MAG TPA: hypothetical protein VNX26_15595 [Candidatus Acidoferrum sp.]|jgi:hypothetical protein|nr:hypothetical protein [Candidatus Acidoferrum sp.]
MAKRRRSELSKATDWRLKTYSLAAMAAGVGALAMVQPAEGEVVITRKKIPIPVSNFFFPPPHPVFISMNNNGVSDFSFSLYSFAYHSRDMDLTARPLAGAAVEGKDQAGVNGFSHFYASMLKRGAKIGPSANFSSGAQFVPVVERQLHTVNSSSVSNNRSYGNWGGNASNTYLGVKFLIDGETHYGWVRLAVAISPFSGLSATITAYAYETEANKRILAGVPIGEAAVIIDETKGPSLGALAAGAEGLPTWRMKQPADH